MPCDLQIAQLQDRLTGALIGLARAVDGSEHLMSDGLTQLIWESLFFTRPDANTNVPTLEALIAQAEEQKRQMVPNCFTCAMPCGRTEDYDLSRLYSAQGENRSLRSQILQALHAMAAHAHPAWTLGARDEGVNRFLYKALFVIGRDDWDAALLMPTVLEVEQRKQQCFALLENARLSF